MISHQSCTGSVTPEAGWVVPQPLRIKIAIRLNGASNDLSTGLSGVCNCILQTFEMVRHHLGRHFRNLLLALKIFNDRGYDRKSSRDDGEDVHETLAACEGVADGLLKVLRAHVTTAATL